MSDNEIPLLRDEKIGYTSERGIVRSVFVDEKTTDVIVRIGRPLLPFACRRCDAKDR
jgi:hypothetical protein